MSDEDDLCQRHKCPKCQEEIGYLSDIYPCYEPTGKALLIMIAVSILIVLTIIFLVYHFSS